MVFPVLLTIFEVFVVDDLAFKRLIFASVLGIQYHPRNDVSPDQDRAVIERALRVTQLASIAFNNVFVDCIYGDDIPF